MGLGKAISVVKAGVAVARHGDEAAAAARLLCSFSADTGVLMADGTVKPISQITPGDQVLATDPATGQTTAKPVTHFWVHLDTLIELRIGDGAVTTTEDHPFWNESDQQWQQAQHLDPGDHLRAANGRTAVVGGLRPLITHTGRAYNLTITDTHTYYVVAGDTPVLVHNSCDQHILLGLESDGLNGLAQRLGAQTLMNDRDWRGTAWTAAQLLRLERPGIRVSVNLDGMAGVEEGVEKAVGKSLLRNARGIGGATDLELAFLDDAGVLGKVDFYIDGVKQNNPFS